MFFCTSEFSTVIPLCCSIGLLVSLSLRLWPGLAWLSLSLSSSLCVLVCLCDYRQTRIVGGWVEAGGCIREASQNELNELNAIRAGGWLAGQVG